MGGRDDDLVMSFKHIGISQIHPPEQILSNVSGYVARGCITAVMGASASGKSVFMRALTGRALNLRVSGEVLIEGMVVDQSDISNSVAYVPQDDILMGELSAREMLRNAAAMKRNKPMAVIDTDVERLLSILGLHDVADNPIGTAFVRGLSGGQKKRVNIGAELVAAPLVLFLDEPTSGLDASIAYTVVNSIRDIVKSSDGKLSLILSIHQPNSRILELFDHILLLGGGAMSFFGTVSESIEYFTSIGFPPPPDYAPTDFFLHVTDTNFGAHTDLNFDGLFATSVYSHRLMILLDTTQSADSLANKSVESSTTTIASLEDGPMPDHPHSGFVDSSHGKTSFWRQYSILVGRGYTLARRDPALYYLQVILLLVFGFLVGAVFFRLKYVVDSTLINISGGITWIVFIMVYLQVFKVYNLTVANALYSHERANNTYSVLPAFLAELTCTSTLLISYIPGFSISYFMMALPNEAFPFLIFVFWMTALTAESMVNFMSRLNTDATTNIVLTQAAMVMLTLFGGGTFIPWNSTPIYWVWLQEISLFTQSSRSAIMHVMSFIDFKCTSLTMASNGICVSQIGLLACDAQSTDGESCYVKGRTVLHSLQGSSRTDSPWIAAGYLVLIFVTFRLGILFLMCFPADRLFAIFQQFWSNRNDKQILKELTDPRRIEDPADLSASFVPQKYEEGDKIAVTTQSPRTNALENLFLEWDSRIDDPSAKPNHDENQFCLVWKNITVNLKKKGTTLIDNVSGVAQSGRVLAMMGPSGAGKTTLLNVLGRRALYANVTGKFLFGGRILTAEDLFFVPQFDEVNSNFTVYEQIEIIGLLKCKDRAAMYARLDKLLQILGLHKKAKSLCNHLTGGELKRVSVGMGMICNPSILFLDEPTTGLDSTAAFSIVKHLIELAESVNVVVIMTIHQPAEMVFDMLQDLYLLESGRLAYAGPRSSTERHFNSLGYHCPHNTGLADFFLDVIHEPQAEGSTSWQHRFLASSHGNNLRMRLEFLDQTSTVAPAANAPPSIASRLYDQIEYFLKYYTRDRGFYYLRIKCLIITGLFVGTVFLRLVPETQHLPKYAGAVIFSIWVVLFSAVTSTGLLARDCRLSVEQVKNAATGPAVYCLAQFIASTPFNFLSSLVFQSIVHWMTNMNPDSRVFLWGIAITWGHLLLMEAIMLTVVQGLGDAMLCVTFAMVVEGALFLFSGCFIKIGDMPEWIRWISYITPTKYSFDGYLYVVFHGQTFHRSDNVEISGDVILGELFGSYGVQPWAMFGVLLAWVGLIHLCHYGVFLYQVMPFLSSRGNLTVAVQAPKICKI